MNKLSFAALSSASVVLLLSGSAIAGMEDPKTNHASYWGDNCTKTEMSGEVQKYTVTDGGVTKVIVKGGTDYVVYEDGNFKDLTAPVNPKNKNDKTYGISHIIECSEPTNPVDPQEPTDPEEPTEPEKPTDPEEPTEPEKPVNPVEPGGKGGPEPETTPEVEPEEAGKGVDEAELPAELPNTGPGDGVSSSLISLMVGVSILVTVVGYKGALSFINNRLS